jgi:hypothetical protein
MENVSRINKLLSNIPTSYDEAVESLKDLIEFSPLSVTSNPIIKNLDNIYNKDKGFFKTLILEYSAFSNQAIHMLLDARIRNHDWEELKKEIDHNIDEEKGEKTNNIPHLEIMRQGYRKDLNIETDNYNISLITVTFLEKMGRIFRSDDNAYAAGALLAFEGTAIPEFYILDKIVEYHNDKTPVKNGLTKYYIDGHKYFEIGHEEGLRLSIKPYINSSNMENFIRGYASVVSCMSNWWNQLYFKFEYRQISNLNNVTEFKIQEVFVNA